MLALPKRAAPVRAGPLTVFVCGPALSGEALSDLTVRDGSVVWEGGVTPAPQPVESITAVHHVAIEGFGRLAILLTDAGLYITGAADQTEPDQDNDRHGDSGL